MCQQPNPSNILTKCKKYGTSSYSHKGSPRVQQAWANLLAKITAHSKYQKQLNEYRKYCLYVDWEGLADHTIPYPLFVNHQSVNEYFCTIVVYHVGNKNTVTRIANALQYYHDNVERK
jgi:hypothetical protein